MDNFSVHGKSEACIHFKICRPASANVSVWMKKNEMLLGLTTRVKFHNTLSLSLSLSISAKLNWHKKGEKYKMLSKELLLLASGTLHLSNTGNDAIHSFSHA